MLDFSIYKRFLEFHGKSILAIDFGFKVTGTAMFKVGIDPFPYPHEKIIFSSIEQSIKEIKKIIHSESIDILVFGIPFFVDGKESEMTLKLKKIYQNLSEQIPEVICYMQDETLTTQTAMERMKSSPEYNFKIDQTRIDTLAATIILEDFIRSN